MHLEPFKQWTFLSVPLFLQSLAACLFVPVTCWNTFLHLDSWGSLLQNVVNLHDKNSRNCAVVNLKNMNIYVYTNIYIHSYIECIIWCSFGIFLLLTLHFVLCLCMLVKRRMLGEWKRLKNSQQWQCEYIRFCFVNVSFCLPSLQLNYKLLLYNRNCIKKDLKEVLCAVASKPLSATGGVSSSLLETTLLVILLLRFFTLIESKGLETFIVRHCFPLNLQWIKGTVTQACRST